MTQQDDFLAGHAIELDVNSLAIVHFRVEDHWLNGDGEVKVDYLEGGVEDIALQIAYVILTDDEVYHPSLLVFLVHYAFILLQLEGFLTTKLD